MRENHLSVVREGDDDNKHTTEALRTVAGRVPRELMVRTEWGSPEATAFFEAMDIVVRSDRMTAAQVEEAIPMSGAADAYFEWLER